MEVYESEREQLDALKKWWKDNGKAVVIGALLGFGSLIGWQQWQSNQKWQRETASMEYDVLLAELDKGNAAGVKERGARILSEFSGTPYAAPTALALAKVNAEAGESATAKSYLQMVIDQNEQPQLKQISQLRLARLLLAEGQAEQALTLIKGAQAGGFAVAFNELEGDIHLALGNPGLARGAYQRALDAAEQGIDVSILQMKLDEVGGAEAGL